MEIGISKKGDLRVLTAKGNLRLQQWRIIGKHLEALLAHGARWVALDLSGAVLLGEESLACLRAEALAFREREANLILIASAACREAIRSSRGPAEAPDFLCADWRELEARLHGRGVALSEA